MKTEDDFRQAKMKLKLTSSQLNINTSKNDVTEYDLYFSRQTTYENSMWLCLVKRDKDGNNIMQLDFDDIPKKTVKKMIKKMQKILDAKMSTK